MAKLELMASARPMYLSIESFCQPTLHYILGMDAARQSATETGHSVQGKLGVSVLVFDHVVGYNHVKRGSK